MAQIRHEKRVKSTHRLDKNWKDPYGYPYIAPTISCEVCNGSKAILKSEVKNHPDKKQITPEEREQILLKMSSSRGGCP